MKDASQSKLKRKRTNRMYTSQNKRNMENEIKKERGNSYIEDLYFQSSK